MAVLNYETCHLNAEDKLIAYELDFNTISFSNLIYVRFLKIIFLTEYQLHII